jgi:predicted unusual protein kinase regulating ubiquinone biosynthesis (AarF/ABC1/UbiB family)
VSSSGVVTDQPAHDCPPAEPYVLRTPSRARWASRTGEVVATIGGRLGPVIAKRAAMRSVPAVEVARPLRKACEDLGATFLKYAQIVASSESLFGPAVAAEFRSCLDTGPVVPFEKVRAELERAADRPLREVFQHIDPNPIGRASLAVVHRARLKDGRDVAVKVLRPRIEGKIAADLALMTELLGPLAGSVAGGAGEAFVDTIEGLREQLQEELDLRNEARTMAYFRALPERAQLPLIVVPETYPELSSRRVLVMEFLDGVPIDDQDWAVREGVDPAPLVEQVLQAWFMTALRGGIFHGDIHAGNILLLTDGRVGLLDWGIVGRLEPDVHRMFRAMVAGALGDEGAWQVVAEAFFAQLGGVTMEFGIDAAALAPMLEQLLGGVLTQPFSEVSFADMVMAPMRQAEELRRQQAPAGRSGPSSGGGGGGGRRAMLGQINELRKMDVDVPKMDRGMMLLAKQLAYFERYGKLYLPDRPLLGDPEFFRSILDAGALSDD